MWTTNGLRFRGGIFSAPKGSHLPYAKLPASPWGNELIEGFAEAALTGEKLGQRGATDLLTVSFSSNDYVGHRGWTGLARSTRHGAPRGCSC